MAKLLTTLSLEEKSNSAVYIPQFDIIRFFAAFMIVIYHSYIAWKGWFGLPGILSAGDYKTFSGFGAHVDQFLRNLPIGVDIFFFISGYLLTYLLVIEKQKYGKVNIPKFYIRRGLRIWPLYFFLVAIAPFLVSWLGEKQPVYWPTIALINNFQTINTQEWIYPFSHFWSICIEEHFYIFWPIIVAFIPIRKLPHAITLLLGFSWCYKIYTYLFLASNWYELYLHTFSRMDVILLGGLLAVFYIKKPFTFKMHWISISLISVILVILLSFDDMSNYENMLNGVTRRFVYIVLIGLIMMDTLFNPDRKSFLGKFKPILYLGKVSYGIYMYGNILVLVVIKKVLMDYHINNIYLYFLIIFLASLIIPVISYELLEKPFLRLKQRFALVKTRL
ncbi:MAG: acyltransferase [Bacteroidales bacterium]|nr:acyltransferase [Bacteroidales bacterium]